MALLNILTPDFVFTDDRGVLTQITHEKFKQINAVFTKKDAARGGWHYHKRCCEYFYVISGCVDVHVKLGNKSEERIFHSGDMFMIEKNVRHNFLYLEDTYLVVMYDERIESDDLTKDIYTDD